MQPKFTLCQDWLTCSTRTPALGSTILVTWRSNWKASEFFKNSDASFQRSGIPLLFRNNTNYPYIAF